MFVKVQRIRQLQGSQDEEWFINLDQVTGLGIEVDSRGSRCLVQFGKDAPMQVDHDSYRKILETVKPV